MMTMEIKGIDGLKRKMNKINRNIKTATSGMMRELGMKTKTYAKTNVINANISMSGTLLKSIHMRTGKNYSTVWSDAGIYAMSWELGMRPHFIHRNMIAGGGYSVGDWMNSKGMSPTKKYIKVGFGTPIGTGIQFMGRAYLQMVGEAPMIVNKWARRILK